MHALPNCRKREMGAGTMSPLLVTAMRGAYLSSSGEGGNTDALTEPPLDDIPVLTTRIGATSPRHTDASRRDRVRTVPFFRWLIAKAPISTSTIGATPSKRAK